MAMFDEADWIARIHNAGAILSKDPEWVAMAKRTVAKLKSKATPCDEVEPRK